MKFYVLAVSLGVAACQQPPQNKSPLFGKSAIRGAQDAGRAANPNPENPENPSAPAANPEAPAANPSPVAANPSPSAESTPAPGPVPAPNTNPNPSPVPAPGSQTPTDSGKASIVGKWKGCANLSDITTGELSPGMPYSQSTDIEFSKDGKHKSEIRFFKASNCVSPYDAFAARAGAEAALAQLPPNEAAMARKDVEMSFNAMTQVIKESGTYKAEEGEAGKTLKLDIDDKYLAYAIKGNELHLSNGCDAGDVEADPEACPKIIGDKPENRDLSVDNSLKLRRVD